MKLTVPDEIPIEHIYVPGQTKDTPVDLIRKVRPDSDFKQQDHSFIRHCRVEFFSVPATWFICTYMIKLAGDGGSNSHDPTQEVGRWQTRTLFWVMFWIGGGSFLPGFCLVCASLGTPSEKGMERMVSSPHGEFLCCTNCRMDASQYVYHGKRFLGKYNDDMDWCGRAIAHGRVPLVRHGLSSYPRRISQTRIDDDDCQFVYLCDGLCPIWL